jgi:hypothetical protein
VFGLSLALTKAGVALMVGQGPPYAKIPIPNHRAPIPMQSILLPGFALAALTFLVWCRLYVERLGQMRRERIHPQAVATSAQMTARLKDTRAADNFRNLFELPVLFYFALLAAAQTGQGGALVLGLAWAFVALRALHSLIHCGYNKVMHRFTVYALGALCLWTLLAVLALRFLQQA